MGKRGRLSDNELFLLAVENGGLSNSRLKNQLDWEDGKYARVKKALLEEGLVVPYQCRGGGIQLTKKGKKAAPKSVDISSNVPNEKGLYEPLMAALEASAKEDLQRTIVCDTSKIMNPGKWQNPDITQISIRHYQTIRQFQVFISTFEVKAWPNAKYDVNVVYEAASHRRFAHESFVVLEWPRENELEFSLADTSYGMDQIARECQRFGIGLFTMSPFRQSGWRLNLQLEPSPWTPELDDIEAWVDTIFSKFESKRKEYNQYLNEVVEVRINGKR